MTLELTTARTFSSLTRYAPHASCKQGPVSTSDRTSYRKIPWSLEAAGLVAWIIVSLWNLTGASAAVLPRCLSSFKVIGQFWIQISRLRDFARSYNMTSYRILKQDPGHPLYTDQYWQGPGQIGRYVIPSTSMTFGPQVSRPWFNIKMSSLQYMKSHCRDKTVVRSSYHHNGISYVSKITSCTGEIIQLRQN